MTLIIPKRSLDKRVVISATLIVLIACVFWLGSRYPQLNEKALMGVDSPISGLAFDTIFTVLPDTEPAMRAGINFINWVYTNWRGMTFGILFGAGLLTLLSLLKTVSFQSRFANAALGMLIGAPMGVCANCAAPIAKGLHSAGSRFETSIGALLASPSLNVIVISISFALLPAYVAATKLIMMILFILLIVPLLGRLADRFGLAEPKTTIKSPRSGSTAWNRLMGWWEFKGMSMDVTPIGKNRFFPALVWVAKNYARSFLFLCLTTIPLMLIAGLIGAILISFVPLELLVNSLETSFIGGPMVILAMLLLAIFAVFLPVPIAFDVILVAILMNAGLDAKYAVVLLLALGPYSLVAYLVIAQSISHRIAAMLGTAVICLAVVGGVVGHAGAKWNAKIHQDQIITDIANVPAPLLTPVTRPIAMSASEIRTRVAAQIIPMRPLAADITNIGSGQISVFDRKLTPQSQPAASAKMFSRVVGPDIGLSELHEFSAAHSLGPMGEVHATAAGDVNGDGWVDIAFNSDIQIGGLGLYINLGGKFVRQDLDLGPMNTAIVGSVAFVDINNDGALDLFVPSYGEGNYVFLNTNGTFDIAKHILLPDVGTIHTIAPSFADLDKDGDLDILLGNSMAGAMQGDASRTDLTGPGGADWVLWNEGDSFTPLKLDGISGHTLTSVIWDVNRDGHPDIMIGDDFAPTDKLYLNNKDRTFRLVTKSDGIIPTLLNTTMSFDFGDINNDLIPEFYGAQITRSEGIVHEDRRLICAQIRDDGLYTQEEYLDCFTTSKYLQAAARPMGQYRAAECVQVDRAHNRGLCRVASYTSNVMVNRTFDDCASIPESWGYYRKKCIAADSPSTSRKEVRAFQLDAVGATERFQNLLLQWSDQSGYVDRSIDFGVATPGWSWNTKFVDLDQDGLQDIYGLIGRIGTGSISTNVMYHNTGTDKFEQRETEYGLYDIMPSASNVFVDFDRDGDVDIVRAPVMKAAIVHENQKPNGAAFWIDLKDEIGNSFGIGSIITVRVGDTTMRRDIKASGGFASADAPMAHFGLGDAPTIDTVEITWVDGTITKITGSIAPNSHLTIVRKR